MLILWLLTSCCSHGPRRNSRRFVAVRQLTCATRMQSLADDDDTESVQCVVTRLPSSLRRRRVTSRADTRSRIFQIAVNPSPRRAARRQPAFHRQHCSRRRRRECQCDLDIRVKLSRSRRPPNVQYLLFYITIILLLGVLSRCDRTWLCAILFVIT